MAVEEYKSIKQEMESLGIKRRYFDKLYNTLKKDQQLPPGDIVPWKQYTTIIDYLRNQSVLGEDNKVLPDGLKIFDSKRNLEKLLETQTPHDIETRGSSGGVLPCTYKHRQSDSSGGIAPCRD